VNTLVVGSLKNTNTHSVFGVWRIGYWLHGISSCSLLVTKRWLSLSPFLS
jgi:hypothetical protein